MAGYPDRRRKTYSYTKYMGKALGINLEEKSICIRCGQICRSLQALSNDQRTTGFSTFGKLFVLAFPGSDMDIEVDMHLQTQEHDPFRVNLTTKWHPNKTEQSAIIRNFLYEVIVLTVNETIKLEPVVQTRFTYHLEALYPFQVLCMFYLRDIERMMHSLVFFMAVPVEGWALRYLVPYAGKWQSIQIINGQSRQAISLLLNYRGNAKLELELNGKILSINEENRIFLSEFEAFSLQLCTEEFKWENLTGSLIWAEHPFSVVHGSCIMKEYIELENKYECLAAFSLDYVLPLTEYAKHFIIVKSVHIRAYVVVVFEKESTKLNYNRIDLPDSKPKEVSRNLGNLTGPAELTTSHPVVVVVVSNAGCSFYRKHSFGDITIGLIVPLGLFLDTYFWIYKTKTYHTDDCLLLVYKRFQEKYIYMDDAPIANMAGTVNVSGVNDYVALDVEIPVNWNMIVHQVYSKNAHKFGAYLYGRHSATEYRISITPLGFVAYNGFILKTGLCDYKYSKQHYPHSKGDSIDNDCDGKTDEEKEDGVDNDNDGMIDEDKALPPLANGLWSDWESWQCESVLSRSKKRFRVCNNPAPTHGGVYCVNLNIDTEDANCEQIMKGIKPMTTKSHNTTKGRSNTTKVTTTEVTTPTTVINANNIGDTSTAFVILTAAKKYPGKWGEWSSWSCMENCTVKNIVRTRPCLDLPDGPRSFDCPGFAYQLGKAETCNFLCAATCPHGHWGFNCSKICPNCVYPCDKKTGACSSCTDGYKLFNDSCNQECDAYKFGWHCLGDCSRACNGDDCIDKVSGKCPDSFKKSKLWFFALAIFLIIPIVILARVSGRRARQQAEDYEMGFMEDDRLQLTPSASRSTAKTKSVKSFSPVVLDNDSNTDV